jgi:hypothetical protein
MRRILVLAAVLALAGLAWGQEAAPELGPNILAGHVVEMALPDGVLVVADDRADWIWAGKATLSIDGRPSALIMLPAASAPLPRRRWGAGDWLAAAGIGLGAAAVAAAAGFAFGALR